MGYIFISWIFSQIEDLYSTHKGIRNGAKLVDLAQQIQAESNRIFKTVLQSILALGASLGLAMSILYKNGASDWNSPDNSNSAFGMLMSFGLVVLGCSIFLGRPYLQTILKAKALYKKGILDKQQESSTLE